jgi:hypothetical protein
MTDRNAHEIRPFWGFPEKIEELRGNSPRTSFQRAFQMWLPSLIIRTWVQGQQLSNQLTVTEVREGLCPRTLFTNSNRRKSVLERIFRNVFRESTALHLPVDKSEMRRPTNSPFASCLSVALHEHREFVRTFHSQRRSP